MIKIAAEASDPDRPFENLLPLVERLVETGNRLTDNGFLLDPDGWRCRLTRPIDFDVLRATFEIPENVALSDEHDVVHDRSSWCVIEGSSANDLINQYQNRQVDDG